MQEPVFTPDDTHDRRFEIFKKYPGYFWTLASTHHTDGEKSQHGEMPEWRPSRRPESARMASAMALSMYFRPKFISSSLLIRTFFVLGGDFPHRHWRKGNRKTLAIFLRLVLLAFRE